MRGLKLFGRTHARKKYRRTLTGAWIETLPPINNNHNHMVAPSRVRGLKL
ncbi:hypothetical protein HMPREF1326_02597, partial [Akkermansia sp. KLE1605]